jgi:hypothetical protein
MKDFRNLQDFTGNMDEISNDILKLVSENVKKYYWNVTDTNAPTYT